MLRRSACAINHMLEPAPRTPKIADIVLNMIEVSASHPVSIQNRILRVMREFEQSSDFIDGKVVFPNAANKCHALAKCHRIPEIRCSPD